MSRTTPITVAGSLVELPGDGTSVHPTLRQTSTARYSGFADLDGLFGSPPVSHAIDLIITRDAAEEEGESVWSTLAATVAPDRSQHEEWVGIANLHVEEFPARFIGDLDTSWFDWLDSIDGDLAVVGSFIDDLVQEADTMALLTGSLMYVRNVDVHPSFSGQKLGARLIAHAFWSLSRSEGDVAALLAKPVRSMFRDGEPDCSAAAIRRLVSYYRRMGFERSQPRERIRDGAAVLMHAHIGEFLLPFRGLGSMGQSG